MIGAQNVDQQIIAAFDLIVVIGDIRREIGPGTVRLLDRAVYIIAEFGGGEEGLLARFPVFRRFAARGRSVPL